MAARRRAVAIDHPVVITFLIFAVIGFMTLAAEFLKPLALAVLLSFALAPVSSFLERRGLPRAAAVVLTILMALGVLAGITFKVGQQLTMLANDLPKYEENIKKKISSFNPRQGGVLERLSRVGSEVAQTLETPPKSEDKIPAVRVVSQPTFTDRLKTAVGPYLERLGEVSFVLILVLFILSTRDDLSDRIIFLFGKSRVTVTTKTMEEVAHRISRYLGMFTLVNSCFGLVIGLGLRAIGLPYAVLWGVLYAMLRFIPYVGPAAAFALPLIFSFAYFEGWREPLMVVALFGTLEVVANSFLEPVIYGRTTGVTALGLLVAAMFWTWLWGGLGLLLSTPMTVSLVVLGKYVHGLGFFPTLLGDEPPLEPDVRFYHRLLEADQDGAVAIVEAALKQQPRDQVFDQILIPTLSRAERDRARRELDESEIAFIWRVIGDLLDDLEETPMVDLKSLSEASEAEPTPGERPATLSSPTSSLRLEGIAVNDHADELVLRMLDQLLAGSGCAMSIVPPPESPLRLAEQVAESNPDLVILSNLPPLGFTNARYMVRRLRARFADLPIIVGYWLEKRDKGDSDERLEGLGASAVVFRVAEARDLILEKYQAKARTEAEPENATPLAPVAS